MARGGGGERDDGAGGFGSGRPPWATMLVGCCKVGDGAQGGGAGRCEAGRARRGSRRRLTDGLSPAAALADTGLIRRETREMRRAKQRELRSLCRRESGRVSVPGNQ